MKDVTKMAWKNCVKEKVRAAFDERKNREKTSTKLRFLQCTGLDTYITATSNVDVRKALKIRLNMSEFIGGNFGEKNSLCTLCNQPDSTEHVFQCCGVANEANVTVDDLRNGERMNEIVCLFDRTEEERRNKTLQNLFEQLEMITL